MPFSRQFQYQAFTEPVPEFAVFEDKWHSPWSEPSVKKKSGPRACDQPFLAFHPNPIISIGWFEAFSEPVRQKPRLHPALQPFLAYRDNPTTVTPFSWFAPLSDPVRFKRGLRASLQQFLASPSRLLPTPTLFGTLSALETKDSFLAGVSAWNRATSAEIGIVDTGFPAAEIGIAVPTVASVSISVQII